MELQIPEFDDPRWAELTDHAEGEILEMEEQYIRTLAANGGWPIVYPVDGDGFLMDLSGREDGDAVLIMLTAGCGYEFPVEVREYRWTKSGGVVRCP